MGRTGVALGGGCDWHPPERVSGSSVRVPRSAIQYQLVLSGPRIQPEKLVVDLQSTASPPHTLSGNDSRPSADQTPGGPIR